MGKIRRIKAKRKAQEIEVRERNISLPKLLLAGAISIGALVYTTKFF